MNHLNRPHSALKRSPIATLSKVAGYFQNVVGFDDIEEFERRRDLALAEERRYNAIKRVVDDSDAVRPEIVREGGLNPVAGALPAALAAGGGLIGAFGGKRPSLNKALIGGLLGAGAGVAGNVIAGVPSTLPARRAPNPNYDPEVSVPMRELESEAFDRLRRTRQSNAKGFGQDFGNMPKYVAADGMSINYAKNSFTGNEVGRGYLTREELRGMLDEQPALYTDAGENDAVLRALESPFQNFTST